MRDGGRSPAIGLQEQVANHRKRLWSKAGVVSVTEKALQRRQVGDRKANTRELLIPEEAAPQFLDDVAPRNGMMPPPDSEMIAPP